MVTMIVAKELLCFLRFVSGGGERVRN